MSVDREGPIQRSIVEYFRAQYPKGFLFSVPNELASKAGGGQKGKAAQDRIRNVQAAAKRLGMLPGAPDLCLLLDGIFYAFEVKAEGNRQQQNQMDAEYACVANGGRYFVVRSVLDVQEVMAAHNPTILEHRGQIA